MDEKDRMIVTFGGDDNDAGHESNSFSMDIDVPQEPSAETAPYTETYRPAVPDEYLQDYKSYTSNYEAQKQAAEEKAEKGKCIHFCHHNGIGGVSVEMHGIHYALPDADPLCLDLHIGSESAAEVPVGKTGNCQRIIDYTADQVFPLQVEIEIETCDFFRKSADTGIQTF